MRLTCEFHDFFFSFSFFSFFFFLILQSMKNLGQLREEK
jgi:hypothetical protein